MSSRKSPRSNSHVIETIACNMIRQIIENDGKALVRELTGRDYGIDFLLELFNDGYPSGEIAFLQVKGTEKKIEKLKKTDEVSCPNVSASSFDYARQKRIPYILIYISISKESNYFYYTDLNSLGDHFISKNQKSFSIRIPSSNRASLEKIEGFFTLVRRYF